MLVFGLCLVLGILLVVFTSLYHTTMPIIVVPSVTVTPSVIPTVTPSSFKLIEDTFAQGGTETVDILSPLHIPEVGMWLPSIDNPDGLTDITITPGDGYAVKLSGSGTSYMFIANNILYNQKVDTIIFDMHATFVANTNRVIVSCGAFNITSGFPIVTIIYTPSGNTMEIVMQIYDTIVDTYTFASPVFDTLLKVSWTCDPTGLVIVYLDNTPILQYIIQIPDIGIFLTFTLGRNIHLNYAAVTIVPPQV